MVMQTILVLLERGGLIRKCASITRVKARLTYPLLAADFDPETDDRLVVGGGGGRCVEGWRDIENKIVCMVSWFWWKRLIFPTDYPQHLDNPYIEGWRAGFIGG